VFLNSYLSLAGNGVLFLADGGDSWLQFHHYWGHIFDQTWRVIFSSYTWDLEGKLRNLKRAPFRVIEPLFLLLCNHED
jgi:hypothetical protein